MNSPLSPLVSVIIPAYNQAHYLPQAIDSVLAQTYANYEIIVVNDGSTDTTPQVCASYEPAIRTVHQPNKGLAAARNSGIAVSNGDLYAFLDSDDWWAPEYLARQVANLVAHPEIGLSHTWVNDVTLDGKFIRVTGRARSLSASDRDFYKQILTDSPIVTPGCVVMRRSCMDVVGTFDDSTYLLGGEDWDLWIRVCHKFPIGVVPEPLVYYRKDNFLVPEKYKARRYEQTYPYIVAKAFDHVTDPDMLKVKPQALSRLYWRLAWINFGVGDDAAARDWLDKSYEVYPQQYDPPHDALIESIAGWADELYAIETPVAAAFAFVDQLTDAWPAWGEHLRRLNKPIKGQILGLDLFRAYEWQRWDQVLPLARHAIRYRPQWLKNRGFVSICIQALRYKMFSAHKPAPHL
jgi:glycosyltransferase involved in cell wall biosynthesis